MSTPDLPAKPTSSELEMPRLPLSLALARPVAPVQPDLEDCCRSGCVPCVFDLYEEALARYERELAAWEAASQTTPPAA